MLLGAKSSTFTLIQSSIQTILNILYEIGSVTQAILRRFQVSMGELENIPESAATTACGAYLIDVGSRGRWLVFWVASKGKQSQAGITAGSKGKVIHINCQETYIRKLSRQGLAFRFSILFSSWLTIFPIKGKI